RVSSWPEIRDSRTVQAGRATGTVIRCGVLDTILADLPISVVFFYEKAADTDLLAQGLSRALEQLPVFGGRLRTEGELLELVCDDAGVSLSTYDVDETLPEAVARVTMPGSGYADNVDAPKARLGGLPLFTARISRLSDGGMVIGCSWHHAVGDLHSFMLLMQAWSAAVEGQPLPEALLVEDPDSYFADRLPATDCGRPGFRLLDAEQMAGLNAEIERSMRTNRTVQIYFGDAELERMREDFSAAAGRRLSRNDVVCAHMMSVLRELNDDHEDRFMALPVNIRARLDLPMAGVGNLVNEIYLRCKGDLPAPALALEIRNQVDNFIEGHLNARANRKFLEELGRDRFGDCVPIGFDPVNRTLTISNWTRAAMYDIPFGGHRPVLASPMANLQLPWIAWLLEGFDNTGLMLTIGVPARLAQRMRGGDGLATLHRYRDEDDQLPLLARAVRKLI
ncbi:MAG: acyltransferase, partial [Jatrophihabitantaceae bacterium]